jgi:hypothetical protein
MASYFIAADANDVRLWDNLSNLKFITRCEPWVSAKPGIKMWFDALVVDSVTLLMERTEFPKDMCFDNVWNMVAITSRN